MILLRNQSFWENLSDYLMLHDVCKTKSNQLYRLNGFPHGLGKGHDAAVVGAWLAQEVQLVSAASIADWR